jgi:hypothetical protein
MKSIIDDELIPFMKEYFKLIYDKKESLVIEGVQVYNPKAQFVGGKVINCCSYIAMLEDKNSLEGESRLKQLKEIIDFTSKLPMETWGMLNGLVGLYRLKLKGVFEQVVKGETLDILKREMDWRNFVDINNDFVLINKPTNYYGVAFGVARYRELLGWETEEFSSILLEKLMKHIDDYSGEFSFMDETPGGGRFDRYSVLIPGEIASLLTETDVAVPEKLLMMLRKSANIYITLANDKGNGFTYGRSVGAYGDTASLEILSIAAYLNVLTEEEKEIAYFYNTNTIKKLSNFWIDKEMKSINMWEKGRRTDQYRNKNRILGENLSLCMQVINSFEHWSKAGFEEKCLQDNYEEKLEKLKPYTLYWFAKGEYHRAMAVIRDKNHVFSLPLISGAEGYYNKTPYLPIPNESQVLETAADTVHPNLIPKIVLKDGTEIMPIAYMKNLIEEKTEEEYCLSYRQDELCRISGEAPEKYEGIRYRGAYCFKSGVISKEDNFYFSEKVEIKEFYMEFATFSEEPNIEYDKITFGKGSISSIEAEGFEEVFIEEIVNNDTYNTPHGPLRYRIQWRKKIVPSSNQTIFKWIINYR